MSSAHPIPRKGGEIGLGIATETAFPSTALVAVVQGLTQRLPSGVIGKPQVKRLLNLVTFTRRRFPSPRAPFEKAWVHICFSLVVFLLFFSSCGSQAGKLTLTEAEKGKTVPVHTGDQITIQLDENPSTGYLWAIDTTDETVLALQHSDYTPTPGGALGRGGTRVFTFIAKSPGTIHLQLKLWRSFEGDSSIIRRYDVTIQVQS